MGDTEKNRDVSHACYLIREADQSYEVMCRDDIIQNRDLNEQYIKNVLLGNPCNLNLDGIQISET